MIRLPRRPSPRGAAFVLSCLCLLALAGCGSGQQPRGLVLESATGTPDPTPSAEPAAAADTCFDVAGAYTAMTLLPLSTDDADPDFHAHETVSSVRELAARMPAELRPAFDDAVVALESAGGSVQPTELAEVQRALAPVDDWLERRCSEPVPGR